MQTTSDQDLRLAAARANGHELAEPVTRQLYNDRRTSWRCTKCGDMVIKIEQGERPTVWNGLAWRGACR